MVLKGQTCSRASGAAPSIAPSACGVCGVAGVQHDAAGVEGALGAAVQANLGRRRRRGWG